MAHAKLNRPWKEPELERLPGGQFESVGALIQDARSLFGSSIGSADTITHLARQYGSAVTEIAALVRESPTLGRAVGPSGTLAAEIVYCLRNEMVVRLPDLLLRRTAAGTAGCPTNAELEETIELAARELGWDSARKEQEAAKIKQSYPLESFSWRKC